MDAMKTVPLPVNAARSVTLLVFDQKSMNSTRRAGGFIPPESGRKVTLTLTELDRLHELLEAVFLARGEVGIAFQLDEPLLAVGFENYAQNRFAGFDGFGG